MLIIVQNETRFLTGNLAYIKVATYDFAIDGVPYMRKYFINSHWVYKRHKTKSPERKKRKKISKMLYTHGNTLMQAS